MGFCVARTRKGSSTLKVSFPIVTCLSCMTSSRADWTLAGARLTSSARRRLQKMGPSSVEKSAASEQHLNRTGGTIRQAKRQRHALAWRVGRENRGDRGRVGNRVAADREDRPAGLDAGARGGAAGDNGLDLGSAAGGVGKAHSKECLPAGCR